MIFTSQQGEVLGETAGKEPRAVKGPVAVDTTTGGAEMVDETLR